jgi:hypothetical protein
MAQQIELKQKDNGVLCLFDTRSNQFMKGFCVRDESAGKELKNRANVIVRRTFKSILEAAKNYVYLENGYLDHLIAAEYLSLNPDIKDKVEKVDVKINKKMVRKEKRGKKKKDVMSDYVQPKPQFNPTTTKTAAKSMEQTVKRGRGRPRKNPIDAPMAKAAQSSEPKRGRGRPRKVQEEPMVGFTMIKRGRGRPRKYPVDASVMPTEKRGRGRPRKNPL